MPMPPTLTSWYPRPSPVASHAVYLSNTQVSGYMIKNLTKMNGGGNPGSEQQL